MPIDIPHPDRLGPGEFVGPWKILEVLGAGGLGRVFKVESEDRLYALKIAVRLPGEKLPDEEDVDGRCMREATAMLERTPHPNIPRVFQVGRWPDAEAGFLYILMEHIDGWRFHDWRYEQHPTAAQLVDVLLPITRTLADLHKAGIHHRDLNANNVLIRREDGRPFVLDFGSVYLPGARTLTQGMPPVDLSVMPPEALEQARLQGDDARFMGGEAADLYALGVLMYAALTDGLPFNPELAPEKLAAVIRLRIPRAPHWVNPPCPRSLSNIAMRLLEKRPEDRFESAEVLHRALWEASKERTSRAWKVSLDLPETGPAPVSDAEMEERKLGEEKARRAAWAREHGSDAAPPADGADSPPAEEVFTRMSTAAVRGTQVIWTWERVRRPVLGMAAACALVAGLMAIASWRSGTAASGSPQQEVAARVFEPPSLTGSGEKVAPPWKWPDPPAAAPSPTITASQAMLSKESDSVKTLTTQLPPTRRAARKAVGVATACTLLSGCPGAQVRPAPPAEECPPGALEAMAEWDIRPGADFFATFLSRAADAHRIEVKEGQTTLHLLGGWFGAMRVKETDLVGRLIFGERIFGRITEARVDGRSFPVCFELEDYYGGRGLVPKPEGSARVLSSVMLRAVDKFE